MKQENGHLSNNAKKEVKNNKPDTDQEQHTKTAHNTLGMLREE